MSNFLAIVKNADLAWSKAKALADRCRSTGNTVPATDLIIAACALVHGANMEHCDAQMTIITDLARKG